MATEADAPLAVPGPDAGAGRHQPKMSCHNGSSTGSACSRVSQLWDRYASGRRHQAAV